MSERERIDRLMGEWGEEQPDPTIMFREWLEDNHPDMVAMAARVLGPPRPTLPPDHA